MARVVIKQFYINTEEPEKFVDELDKLCKKYANDNSDDRYAFIYKEEEEEER